MVSLRLKRKILFFQKCGWWEKFSPWHPQFFLNQFNWISLIKVYTERTTLTEPFFVEKQRVLPFNVWWDKKANSSE